MGIVGTGVAVGGVVTVGMLNPHKPTEAEGNKVLEEARSYFKRIQKFSFADVQQTENLSEIEKIINEGVFSSAVGFFGLQYGKSGEKPIKVLDININGNIDDWTTELDYTDNKYAPSFAKLVTSGNTRITVKVSTSKGRIVNLNNFSYSSWRSSSTYIYFTSAPSWLDFNPNSITFHRAGTSNIVIPENNL